MGDLDSVRENFSRLLNKLPTSLRKAALLPLEKRASVVKMLTATVLLMSLTLTLVAFSSYSHSVVIRSGGTVNLPVGVGFYWDSNCTNPVTFLDWGPVEPGSAKTVVIYVRNEGSQGINLNITAENWDPEEITSYMTFSSDYNGRTIHFDETLQITLTLTTSSSIEGITNFSFHINVAINRVFS